MPAQLVHAMARLQIADQLADGPLTVEELSSAADAQPGPMRRLVRGLASVGLVEVDSDDRVSLTETGALLGSDVRGSMRDMALHFGSEAFSAWGKLDHSVRTGEPGFEAVFDEPFFSYTKHNPEAGAAFDGTMTRMSQGVIAQAVAAYDFAGVRKILDVGGGRGHFVAAVLEAHPNLEGAVFDQPHVVEAAADYLSRSELSDRCAVIGGSFFESLPPGFDLHILKWILHDWNNESCGKILASCRAALPADGRLLVVERLLPEETVTSRTLQPAIASDLNMLVNFGDAVERSLADYERLLRDSGFSLAEVIALQSGFSVLDFRPQPS
jgi:O-methyltransferase